MPLDLGLVDGDDWDAAGVNALEAGINRARTFCTSSTRPSSPSEGTFIYETDTDRTWYYNGSAWRLVTGPIPRTRVYSTAGGQSIPNNTNTVVLWNQESFDTDSFHSTSSNTGRLVAPVTGLYSVSFNLNAAAGAATSIVAAWIQWSAGGGDREGQVQASNNAASGVALAAACDIPMAAGDYVEVYVYQNSGGALNVATAGSVAAFRAAYRGPLT